MGKTIFKEKLDNKAFLNNNGHHSVAAIGYSLETVLSEYNSGEMYVHADGTMWVSDCNRVISLELDFNKEGNYENTKFKLQQIIDIAKQALDDLEIIRESYVAAEKTIEDNEALKQNESVFDNSGSIGIIEE